MSPVDFVIFFFTTVLVAPLVPTVGVVMLVDIFKAGANG